MLLRRALLMAWWQKTSKLPPVADESGKDPSFAPFRRELLAAVARKDTGRLLMALADDVIGGFGGPGGRAAFIGQWGLDKPKQSRVWRELRTLLELGGTFDAEGNFTAPYTSTHFPIGWDEFYSAACVRPRVTVLAAPRAGAAAVGQLQWEIVELPSGWSENRYVRVRTAGGMEGWVAVEQVRSPMAARARFARISGQWRLVFLVEGG